ncbi:MAG: peroxide stress protein YaaA [Propionivibrio sp.]
MLILLSPAKSLDFETPPHLHDHSQPDFLAESARLIGRLRELAPNELASLMGISDPLAELNVGRYAAWSTPFTPANAKPAVLAFNGDVYEGLDAGTLSAADLLFAQDRVRILSGLYGVLRPLDLIQPYRLEMGTRLVNSRGKDLYAFWGSRIAEAVNAAARASGSPTLVNLASDEYFKAVGARRVDVPFVQPVFEDWSKGTYKVVSFYAKRARGLMARYAVQARLDDIEGLKDFSAEGYAYDPEASSGERWVFRRRLA